VSSRGAGSSSGGRQRLAAALLVALASAAAAPRPTGTPRASDWLGLLPAGEEKRKFILDCAGCHQFDATIALRQDQPRTAKDWQEAVQRMLGYAGANSSFPVMAHDRDPETTARFLAAHVARTPGERRVRGVPVVEGAVTEFDLPVAPDLPHDVAVNRDGKVVVTGMFSHRMFVLDPATGAIDSVMFPFPRANPRAVEIDSAGDWWVALGAPHAVARYEMARREWKTYPLGFYPHSVALGRVGEAWANGHFTRAPELIARVRAQENQVDSFRVPPHPALANVPGGPVPYEIRVAPDGRVWGSELVGNRIFAFDPATGAFETHPLPVRHSGPRRFDFDRDGALWIPTFAANELVRFDPKSKTFQRIPLPVPDAVPYVVRVDARRGTVWVGTSAADAILGYDPARRRFTLFRLPSRGAMVRHLAIDPRNGDAWAAYGASPGPLPSRIARLRPSATR
jgi:streptogramin lyase